MMVVMQIHRPAPSLRQWRKKEILRTYNAVVDGSSPSPNPMGWVAQLVEHLKTLFD